MAELCMTHASYVLHYAILFSLVGFNGEAVTVSAFSPWTVWKTSVQEVLRQCSLQSYHLYSDSRWWLFSRWVSTFSKVAPSLTYLLPWAGLQGKAMLLVTSRRPHLKVPGMKLHRFTINNEASFNPHGLVCLISEILNISGDPAETHSWWQPCLASFSLPGGLARPPPPTPRPRSTVTYYWNVFLKRSICSLCSFFWSCFPLVILAGIVGFHSTPHLIYFTEI